MDYDVIYVDDERNATRVNDHRRRPGGNLPNWFRPPPAPRPRTVVVPPGARPTVITGGSSSTGYYRPVAYPPMGDSIASRFGMTMGELIDTGLQVLVAIQPLPAAPTAQGDARVDVANLVTYEGALWDHAKRNERFRTLGGLLARVLR